MTLYTPETLLSSSYMKNDNIGGVLIIDGNTFGRVNDKLLYKCIPDDNTLPYFLIPFEDKNVAFSKVKINKYITFRIKEWEDKHPIGIITNTIGNVDDIEAYINYQLICKEMNSSIKQLNTATLRALREKPISKIMSNYNIEDRRSYSIFSIDPAGCNDIDDAIGIRKLSDGQVLLSIYISNVPLMLDYFDLWEHISDRISTIYFPHKKIPMLPVSLSENKLSLLQSEERVAFVLDVYTYNGNIKSISYKSALICVEKNYAYEERDLLMRNDYNDILKLVKQLNQDSFKYLEYVDNVKDSHDVVEFCMIFMNHECSKILKSKNRGIFRAATKKEIDTSVQSDATSDATSDAKEKDNYEKAINSPDLIFILQNSIGEYCSADAIKPHELIGKGLDSYVHITSPIRRIVDIINMLEMQYGTVITSKKAEEFLISWLKQINLINIKTKAIRRLQNDVQLLKLYDDKNDNQIYSGMVFARSDIITKNDNTLFKYRVYIPEIKLLTSLTIPHKIINYSMMDFTLHLFLDEIKMNKKVRLQLLYNL